MITTVEQMIRSYVEAWNGNNLADFKTAFGNVWAKSATYTDPDHENLTGVDAIANLALESFGLFPGRKFEVLTQPEAHHNVGRYTWKVTLSDGSTRIVSFF